MAILKKKDILNGINKPQKIEIKALGGELWLRPLSNAEIDDIEEIEAKAMGTFKTNEKTSRHGKGKAGESVAMGEINLARSTRASAKVKIEFVTRSLDNEKNQDDEWTEEEVGKLSRNAFEEIYNKVRKMSGLDVTESDVDNFPEDD